MSPKNPTQSPSPKLSPQSSLRRPRLQTSAFRLLLLSTLLLSLLLLQYHHPVFLYCDYRPPPPYSHLNNPSNASSLSDAISAHGLLFIIPRPDGLSNQRITLAQSLHCARLKNRVAVLPPIFANTRYGTRVTGPFRFADYFDLHALKSLNISFATHDALDESCVIHGSKDHVRNRLASELKRKMVATSFEDMQNERCVTQAICDGLNWTSEFGIYSNYTNGQWYSVTRSNQFRTIRAAIQPSAFVTQIAGRIKRKLPRVYNAVHIRRSDFRSKCSMQTIDCKRFGRGSVDPSADYIVKKVLQMPKRALFISTEDPVWARQKLRPRLAEVGIRVVLGDEVKSCWMKRVDVRAMADQVVCVGAEQFLGNRFSSFSADIVQARVLQNKVTESGLRFLR